MIELNPTARFAWHRDQIIAARDRSPDERLTLIREALNACGEAPGFIWEECECLRELGHRQLRLTRLNRLAALQPNDAVVLVELGRALLGSNSAQQAVIPLRAAYRLGKRSVAFLVSLASAEISAQELARAELAIDEALSLDPNDFSALAFRCNVAHRACDFAATALYEPRLLKRLGEVTQNEKIVDTPVAPFLLLASDATASEIRDYSAHYYRKVIAAPRAQVVARAASTDLASRRVRVGYLAGDFHGHAVSILTVGMFERSDRSRFENFALSHGPRVENAYRVRLKTAFEHWLDLNELSDSEATEAIAQLNLDVLIDLKGCTSGARPRIVAARPAPVQAHFLAYPSSMSLPGVDYYIADETTVPHGREYEFSERVIRLPGCFFPNDDRRERPVPALRAQLGLPEDAFVMCNFNQTWKLRERYVRCWFAALARHSHAVLWLGDPGKSHPSRKHLSALASQYGVADRVIWANYPRLNEHLARLAQADLAVDQSPYNSHTTAADALWMGVPVLTCKGERFDSRVAASLLKAASAEEWIASDFTAYEAKLEATLANATNSTRPRERNVDRFLHTELFDTERFVRKWEAMITDLAGGGAT